ncbi:MAG: 3-methyladenine DNA glycosylase AlkD [Planctomycetota bacterium]|jgi:3-methyladenine DNA glycosylase AlkD
MNKTETMKKLKDAGKESHKKTYLRHGITLPTFGVPYADLYKLQKQIGVDQGLADQLWKTGNHDARTLATLIADAPSMKATEVDAWARDSDNQLSIMAVALVAARVKNPVGVMKKWMKLKKEWQRASGWQLLSVLCSSDECPLAEAELTDYLGTIEKEIDGSMNRVKHEMNGALIAMSRQGASMKRKCVAAAKRIGKVDVDHGNTACKTPDAIPYIEKMAARLAKKKTTKKKAVKKTAKKK